MISSFNGSAHGKKTVGIRPRIRRDASPKIIELFCGAGMFGFAFKKEGFRPVAAYERDLIAASTYARNVSPHIAVEDLANMTPRGETDVILAGPPCQGFSSIGAKAVEDPRNALCLVVPSWARETRAKVVVIENVPQFLDSGVFEILHSRMRRLGYSAVCWRVNARDFEVPQNRRRSIVVFSRLGDPDEPKQSARNVTVRNAFCGLPNRTTKKNQHYSRVQTTAALERIRLIPLGGDIRDLALVRPDLVPPSWFATRGKIVDIWGRMNWDDVSNTIRTGFLHPSKGRFIHPEEDRPITFREAARLQTVPDEFEFEGCPQQLARQIGNGVPFNLGRSIARTVLNLF